MTIEQIIELLEELDGHGVIFTDQDLAIQRLQTLGISHDTFEPTSESAVDPE